MNLSADALKCRADRIEANKVRESKAKAKAKTTAPPGPKKAIAVNTNSAAARRLAAMRGGQHPISDGLPRATSEVSSVFAADETDFDPFGSSSATFDPFGSALGSAPIAAELVGSSPTRTTPINFFDAFPDSSSISDQLFSVTEDSAASSRQEEGNSFDPFSAQVADGFESTACRSPTLPSRQFSMFSSSSRNPSIINSPDDFFAPSSSSTSINNTQNQEWSSIDADAFGYNEDGDRGGVTTTQSSTSSNAAYGEVDFFNLDNEPSQSSSSISAKKPIPMKPPKPSSSSSGSAVPETGAVSVEASRSAASRLFTEATSSVADTTEGTAGSPSKPSKPMKPKKQSDEQCPALIDFDTDSSIDYNVESSIAYATPSRAVPPKPSKRESISLIDFDYSVTISEFPKADTAATSGATASRYINPFEEDLLEMPVAPPPSINSKHTSASLQADVLSLYDLPMSPPPIPTQAPPGIKPAKPSVMIPQYAAATSSMNSPAIDARFGAPYLYPSAASPRPAQQQQPSYPPQQLPPSSPRYPTTPSTHRGGGPMTGSSYDPFSSIQPSFGKH